ncbi:DinB family protein [Virgibacillus soli]|uniref:DinB family protein n=1 Tax=Paracerasibacillus soli TaxID=480284 RepID=UPI0035E6BB07
MKNPFEFTRQSFLEFVKGVDETTADTKLENFNNTIHWQVGHVLVSAEGFLFGNESQHLPAHYQELFATGTKPADWKDNVPTLHELIKHLEDQYVRISELSDEFLKQALPFELPFGNFKTYEDLYFLSIHHEAMHLGQMQAMKKMINA